MSAEILGAATGPGSARIGRYFTVVSALPSAVFVSYLYLLVASGAWSGPVRFDLALRRLDLRAAGVLAVSSFLVAVTLHPLQFTLIQLLEGYWGRSAPARTLAFLRVRHHRRLSSALNDATAFRNTPSAGTGRAKISDRRATDDILRAAIDAREAQRLLASYPESLEQVLPTRLGNVLRRYEVNAGYPYKIDAVHAVPRIAMVAGDREVQYVENQRTQLELAVRTSVLAMLAAASTIGVMWRQGPWLLLALAPYVVGYLSYRGAIVAAHEYGIALTVLIELNRFELQKRFHLQLPTTLADERKLNTSLMQLLRSLIPEGPVDYDHAVSEAAGSQPHSSADWPPATGDGPA